MRVRKWKRAEFRADQSNRTKAGGIHPVYEVLKIVSGRCDLIWMGCSFEAKAGSTFIIAPNTPHTLRIKEDTQLWYVEAEPDERKKYIPLDDVIRWNHIQHDCDWQDSTLSWVKQSISILEKWICHDSNPFSVGEIQHILALEAEKLLYLIRCAMQQKEEGDLYQQGLSPQTNRQMIEGISQFIEGRYMKKITLEMLARRVHLNSSYLIRLYKENTGNTPLKYLNELRLQASASYLMMTDMTVQEISEATGFSSIHYFSQSFKQRFHMSPSVWRTKHRKNGSRKSDPLP